MRVEKPAVVCHSVSLLYHESYRGWYGRMLILKGWVGGAYVSVLNELHKCSVIMYALNGASRCNVRFTAIRSGPGRRSDIHAHWGQLGNSYYRPVGACTLGG